MNLLADEALAVFERTDAECLHDVPAGIVGAADIAHLALAHERIERFHGFLEWRLTVPFMNLVKVDHVGLQTLQARLAGVDQVMARQASVIGTGAHREARLGGDEHAVLALSAENFADDLLAGAGRIDVRRIDQIDARIQA